MISLMMAFFTTLGVCQAQILTEDASNLFQSIMNGLNATSDAAVTIDHLHDMGEKFEEFQKKYNKISSSLYQAKAAIGLAETYKTTLNIYAGYLKELEKFKHISSFNDFTDDYVMAAKYLQIFIRDIDRAREFFDASKTEMTSGERVVQLNKLQDDAEKHRDQLLEYVRNSLQKAVDITIAEKTFNNLENMFAPDPSISEASARVSISSAGSPLGNLATGILGIIAIVMGFFAYIKFNNGQQESAKVFLRVFIGFIIAIILIRLVAA